MANALFLIIHISCLYDLRTKSSMIPAPLVSITTRQVTGEGLDLFATFTVHLKNIALQVNIKQIV